MRKPVRTNKLDALGVMSNIRERKLVIMKIFVMIE